MSPVAELAKECGVAIDEPDEKMLFLRAIEFESDVERAEFLRSACGDHSPLRSRVEALLVAHGTPQGYLDAPDADASAREQLISEKPGTRIGPYELVRQLGDGGMGVVFLAEQTQPVQRSVALKIIKPGMDTRQVIARFEAERQALALMDHPNIARILDAGATETGRVPGDQRKRQMSPRACRVDRGGSCRLRSHRRCRNLPRLLKNVVGDFNCHVDQLAPCSLSLLVGRDKHFS
jgi:hypothetical protein